MKFVKADKPVTTNHKDHGKIEVEVEVPQVESVEEAVQFCGGPDGFLAYFNGNLETSAKNGGRAFLRNIAKDANLEEVHGKARDLVKNYTPEAAATRGPSVKAKAETLDKVAELVNSGREFTREELLAMLSAAR